MQKYLVLNGRVFTGFESIEDGAVIIDAQQGIFEGVGNREDVKPPSDATVIYAKNETILPALIDAHVHFFGAKQFDRIEWNIVPEPLAALRAVSDLRRLLYAGFAAVRDLGGKVGSYLNQALKENAIEGPRVVSCGRSIAGTGGNDDPKILPLDIAQALSYSYYCDGPWDCRKAVRKVLRDGAEVVKVYVPGTYPSESSRNSAQLTMEELTAITDEAHNAGVKVAAHATSSGAIMKAVEAGVDSIEHGIELTDEVASRMREKGVFYVPTLSAFEYIDTVLHALPAGIHQQHFIDDLKMAQKHNVKIVTGTDCIGSDVRPHGQNYREIALIARVVGNREAIKAATVNAAECLGLGNCGQIKRGFEANAVIVNGDPLDQIESLNPKNTRHVISKGRILTRESHEE
jgi:imidazolonepropionase-like amidohydrolase